MIMPDNFEKYAEYVNKVFDMLETAMQPRHDHGRNCLCSGCRNQRAVVSSIHTNKGEGQ